MKSLTAFILILTSLSVQAQRMCPLRTLEIVACKEQNSISISICETKDEKFLMIYRRSPHEEAEVYSTVYSENQSSHIFTRESHSAEGMELVVQKTIDDHTQGLFSYQTPTIRAQISFRCLTRLQTQW